MSEAMIATAQTSDLRIQSQQVLYLPITYDSVYVYCQQLLVRLGGRIVGALMTLDVWMGIMIAGGPGQPNDKRSKHLVCTRGF